MRALRLDQDAGRGIGAGTRQRAMLRALRSLGDLPIDAMARVGPLNRFWKTLGRSDRLAERRADSRAVHRRRHIVREVLDVGGALVHRLQNPVEFSWAVLDRLGKIYRVCWRGPK